MQVEEVDERDSTWEIDEARFRVYVFRGCKNATSCYDITAAEVLDAVRWAQTRCGEDERYALALVHDASGHDGTVVRGLTWLLGVDANIGHPDRSAQERLAGMEARRGRIVVLEP